MPWARHHRKEKFRELDKKRRPKRREYFKNYMKKYNQKEEEKQKNRVRSLTRLYYGKALECNRCGTKKGRIQFHHFEDYEVHNFICLCETCHIIEDYHKRYNKKREVEDNGRRESKS